MGKSSRNRSTLAMLNEGDQQTVITYMKDNILINTFFSFLSSCRALNSLQNAPKMKIYG
jgi:hypothetical protein